MAEVNIDVAKESTGQQILSAGAKETTSQEILSKLASSGGAEKRYYYSEDVFPAVLINSEISEAGAPGYKWNYYLGEFVPEHTGNVCIEISLYFIMGNGYGTTGNFYAFYLDGEKDTSPVFASNTAYSFVLAGDIAVGTIYDSGSSTVSNSGIKFAGLSINGSTTYQTFKVMVGVKKGVPMRFFTYFNNSSQYIRNYVNSLKIGYVVK